MLPSPGFSIPSIGTPLHQPEADQQILPNAVYQQQMQMNAMSGGQTPGTNQNTMGSQQSSSSSLGQMTNPFVSSTNDLNSNSMSGGMNNLNITGNSGNGMPSLMSTPTKQIQSYAPNYSTPQSMMQPQTPVRIKLKL